MESRAAGTGPFVREVRFVHLNPSTPTPETPGEHVIATCGSLTKYLIQICNVTGDIFQGSNADQLGNMVIACVISSQRIVNRGSK